MIQPKKRISKKSAGIPLLFLLTLLTFNVFAQGDPKAGKELFEQNACNSCHPAINRKGIGPALKDVHLKRSEDWLIKWIRNNVKLRESGDAQAIALYKENGGAAMNVFENLSEGDVKNIIAYLKEESEKKVETTGTAPGGSTTESKQEGFYSETTYYILLAIITILTLLTLVLYRVKRSIKKVVKEKYPEDYELDEKQLAFKKKLSKINPTIATLGIVSLIGLSFGLYGFYFGVTEVGVQKGYAPEQPINFSHKIHAGDLNIDCKYCHSTAEKSKSASIPSLNTCMNCHKGVQLREKYNDQISPEIQKIYTALDYNPEGDAGKQYGPNPKPIKWVRIHNLPDHAYFNHSQHVNVAGLACQKCHGPIETMEKVQQHATLQMGWCINCHRETGIDVANNDYYEKLHAKAKSDIEKNGEKSKYLKNGKVFITEAMNGGLECAKCHY